MNHYCFFYDLFLIFLLKNLTTQLLFFQVNYYIHNYIFLESFFLYYTIKSKLILLYLNQYWIHLDNFHYYYQLILLNVLQYFLFYYLFLQESFLYDLLMCNFLIYYLFYKLIYLYIKFIFLELYLWFVNKNFLLNCCHLKLVYIHFLHIYYL